MGIGRNVIRCREANCLGGVQRRLPYFQSSFDVSSYGTSRYERTVWSYMENVAYNYTPAFGTCKSFGSVYSFCISVYDRSYFSVLKFKDLINEDSKLTTSFKLATGTKPSVSHLRVLFCPCVVPKATAHVDKKALNMCHQVKKGFCGVFVGI